MPGTRGSRAEGGGGRGRGRVTRARQAGPGRAGVAPAVLPADGTALEIVSAKGRTERTPSRAGRLPCADRAPCPPPGPAAWRGGGGGPARVGQTRGRLRQPPRKL